MAAGQAGVQLGQAGNAFAKGIPAMTITWKGMSGTDRSATIFNTVEKGVEADVSDSTGNNGEWLASRRRNKRIELQVEAKPTGAKQADARAIASDLPVRNDLATIAGAADTTLNAAGWIINAKPTVRYSPEGDSVISFSLKLLLNDDGTPIIPTVLLDS